MRKGCLSNLVGEDVFRESDDPAKGSKRTPKTMAKASEERPKRAKGSK